MEVGYLLYVLYPGPPTRGVSPPITRKHVSAACAYRAIII